MNAPAMVPREVEIALRHRRGRKSPDLIARLRWPAGREQIWTAIRKCGKGAEFELLDIEAETRIPLDTINSYLQGLLAAGIVSCTGRQRRRNTQTWLPRRYTLEKDCGVEAPRVDRKGRPIPPTGRELLWLTMRILKQFSQAELVAAASTGDRPIHAVDAADYIKHLSCAGYLKVCGQRAPGRPARYLLVPARNSGPLPPQVQRIQQVWDANLCRVVWPVRES